MKLLSILFCVAVTASAVRTQAQQPHVLHNFVGQAGPVASLTEGPDGNFYGTTRGGGSAGRGTVYRITPDGTLTTLVSFTGPNGNGPYTVRLTLDGKGNFYGATDHGGSGGHGTVFQITTNGILTTLVNFNNINGTAPRGLTSDSDGTLYGTTVTSIAGEGTVFKVATNGTFTTLVTFPTDYGSFPAYLTFGPDGALYGRTYNGNSGMGTVYRVTTDGVLSKLATLSGCEHPYSTALTLGNDGNFYGTTFAGGTHNRGIAFRVTPQGALTTLLNFNGSNGFNPADSLTLGSDGDLYGTTVYGGIFEGTVFKMKYDGTLTTLAQFPSRSFGVRPYSGVAFGSDGNLYGTTITGGSGSSGIIYRVTLDADGDGVADVHDSCPGTAPGGVVNEHGCSIEQLVPCNGPRAGGKWKNHGEYVSAVANLAMQFWTQGIISEDEAEGIVLTAGESRCGKK